MDPGGDERFGWWIAGGLMLLLGWGLAVVANLVVHLQAGSGGTWLGPIRVTSHFGSFALVTLGIGVFTGLIGVGLLWVARQSPKGPFVLPGASY